MVAVSRATSTTQRLGRLPAELEPMRYAAAVMTTSNWSVWRSCVPPFRVTILIAGAGTINEYCGTRLSQPVANVNAPVRPTRTASLAAVVREDVKPGYNLIIRSWKACGPDAVVDEISSAIGPYIVILPPLSGISSYGWLDTRFSRDRVLLGVAYLAVMHDQGGVIRHFDAHDVVTVGARSGRTTDATEHFFALNPALQAIAEHDPGAMEQMGDAPSNCLDDLPDARDGTRHSRRARRRAPDEATISECCAVAGAECHALSDDDLRGLQVGLLDANSTSAASMTRDIAQNAPRAEAQAIVGDLIVRPEDSTLELTLARPTATWSMEVSMRRHA